jgi:hypothetical protein
MATPLISPKFQAWDPRTGLPLAFGQVATYEAGTLSQKPTYSDPGGTAANTNPVILNGSGVGDIFLAGKYNIIVTASDGYQVWSSDNVSDLAHIYEEWVYPTAAIYASAVQFKVAGSMADVFVSGRPLKISDAVTFFGVVSSSYYSGGYTFVTVTTSQPLTNNLAFVSVSGATTATKLAVPRTINGVPFDGTADVTIPVSAADQAQIDGKVGKTGATGSAAMPAGTTAQRDASPGVGYIRDNTTLGMIEYWNGLAWVCLCDNTNTQTLAGIKTYSSSPVVPDLAAFDKSTKAINSDFHWNNMPAVRGSFANLKLSSTGTSAVITYSADSIVLKSASGLYIVRTAVSLTASTGSASGVVNSLDTGAWAYNTFYFIYHIYNPTSTTDGLLFSLSSTAPTLPSGYTISSRIGALRTQSATAYYPLGFTQAGRTVRYRVAPGSNVTAPLTMASGTSITEYTAVAVGSFIPVTASSINVGIATNSIANSQHLSVAPNGSYVYTNAPLMFGNGNVAGCGISLRTDIILESVSIYWEGTSAATASLLCYGWEDNL